MISKEAIIIADHIKKGYPFQAASVSYRDLKLKACRPFHPYQLILH